MMSKYTGSKLITIFVAQFVTQNIPNMQQVLNILKQLPSFAFKYKFNILTIIYYCVICSYPDHSFRPIYLLGACSLFFVHNLIAKMPVSILWTILFSILIGFNAYVAFMYGNHVIMGVLASIFETTLTEASSVLGGLMFPAILTFIATIVLIYLSVREHKDSKLRGRVSLLVIFIYCYTLLPLAYRKIVISDLRDSYNKAPLYTMQIAVNYYSPVVYGNVMTILAYANEMYTFYKFSNTERIMPEGIVYDDAKQTVKKIFLIVGESSTPSHMSLYGYSQETTPFAKSLHESDSTKLLFYKGRSTASFTRNAVPAIVSTSNAIDPTLFYQEKTLIDLSKELGFETSWISNQARMDFWSSKANFIGSLAATANNISIVQDGEFRDDFALLDILDNFYTKTNNEKQLYVIHLQGSHYQYVDKYDSVDVAALPGDEKELSHMYDLTIHHTDRFLETIYNKYVKNDDSAMMLYASDHGEDVGIHLGHGVIPISAIQFHVPFIIYNNSRLNMDSIASKYVDEYNNLSNSNAVYILLESIGYNVSDQRVKRVVEEGQYAIHADNPLKIVEIEPYSLVKEDDKTN